MSTTVCGSCGGSDLEILPRLVICRECGRHDRTGSFTPSPEGIAEAAAVRKQIGLDAMRRGDAWRGGKQAERK